ncbi:MAG: hypothetical protein KGL39_54460 [Patescibacteria group bacterium]|nr:hypothetical protein [Patescibacteria group bacterium]
MKNAHYRQGDVLIERIDKIPKTATKQKKAVQIILAHGEVTGHHHVLNLKDPADWWKEGEIAPTLEKPSVMAGEIFVSLKAAAEVTHDEHSVVALPPGIYRVTRQREYSPEAIRNVAD